MNEITGWDNQSTEVNPTYDAAGNLTNDQRDWKYTYDAWYRLVEVRDQSNNLKAQFRYNGLGFRVSMRYDDTDPTEQFWYHNAGASGMGSSSYIDEVVLRDRDTDGNGSLDERIYYCQNWHRDIAMTCDTGGSVAGRINYDAYGSHIGTFSTTSNRKGYSGYEHDPKIEHTYHVRHRIYRPDLGVWTSRDPLIYFAGLNLMNYAGSSPVNRIDPGGLAWSNISFVIHYMLMGGAPITLGQVGLGLAYQSHPLIAAKAREHEQAIDVLAKIRATELLQQVNCCGDLLTDIVAGTLRTIIDRNTFIYWHLFTTGKFLTDYFNFWYVDWTFSIGGHIFYTDYVCNISAYCQMPSRIKCYGYQCDITHRMSDKFSDPFDMQHIFGFPLELEMLSTSPWVRALSGPYQITYSYQGNSVQGGQCGYW